MKLQKELKQIINIRLIGAFFALISSFFLLFMSLNFRGISLDNNVLWWFIKISQFIYILITVWALVKIVIILVFNKNNKTNNTNSNYDVINNVIVPQNCRVLTNNIIRNTILDIEDDLKKPVESNINNTNFSSEKNFYEYIPLPLVTTNKIGKIISCNKLAQDFFNTDLIDKNISSFITPLEVNTLNYCNVVNVNLLHLPSNKNTSSIFQTSIFNNNEIELVILLFLPTGIDFKQEKNLSSNTNNNLESLSSNLYVKTNPNKDLIYFLKEFINDFNIGLIVVNLNKVIYFNNKVLDIINIINKHKNNNPFSDNHYKPCKVGDNFKASFNNIFSEEQLNNILSLQGKKFQIKFQNYYLDISYKCKDSNIFITLEDVSEKRKLELQNTFSQRLQTIGQIASAVAHDFNNLLTAIMSFTYFLKERYSEEDPSSLELEQIEQNSNRAKVMIRQLLTFSRGKELNPVSFLVNSEISNLMSTILRLMGERIKTEFIRGRNIGKITMDPVQFQQVIINLVVNARDAMKNNGKLIISTNIVNLKLPQETVLTTIPAGDYIVISIKDQGEGIKKENFKKIFQTHFSTKGEKGNGLGLATVAKIMQDNSGFIALESTLNKGTTFHLYFANEKLNNKIDNVPTISSDLPLTTSQVVDSSKDITLDLTGTGTILLVEDEIPVRTVCKRALVSKGYQVIEAEDAETALTLLQNITNKVDLIISDVMMPGISGLEFISEAKKINPDLKAILMSGYAEEALEDNHYTLDSIEFLAKPFNPDVLATKVKKVITS